MLQWAVIPECTKRFVVTALDKLQRKLLSVLRARPSALKLFTFFPPYYLSLHLHLLLEAGA